MTVVVIHRTHQLTLKLSLAKYREERYYECRANNPNFYFGVLSLLLFGAASFSYAGFPGASHQPDLYTMTYFFVHEQIPPNWYNRVDPYNNQKVTDQILRMYLLHPVEFGKFLNGTRLAAPTVFVLLALLSEHC